MNLTEDQRSALFVLGGLCGLGVALGVGGVYYELRLGVDSGAVTVEAWGIGTMIVALHLTALFGWVFRAALRKSTP